MHLRRWLFATSSIINEIAGLPIPNLQQSSLSEAVLPTSKQQSNLLRRFFPERLAPNILAQANTIPDDDTISHIQNALEYLVTYPELDRRSAPMNSDLATRSFWSQTLQIAARLKRQTTCGNGSQCGNGDNNNGSGNGINNNGSSGDGISTSDRIALGVGLGVGLPTAIGSIYGFYRWILKRGKVKSKNMKNQSEHPTSRLQQNGGPQSQVQQPHRFLGLGSDQSQWQTPVELETFRR